MATVSSSATSLTATDPPDLESQSPTRQSHFSLILDQAGVTPEVLHRKYPGNGTADSPYVIDFLPDDQRNPITFPFWKKWAITLLQAIATLAVALVSTAYSGGIAEVIREFRISTEIAILGISLFVVGFAVGPLLWAPLSEMFGRQKMFIMSYVALTAFNAGAAGAQNIHTLIILRFLAGAFGSSPLTNAGGVIADMFSASERGLATAIFAAAPFLGPSIGPIAGGFLGTAAGWRWVEGMLAIFTGTLLILVALFVPETYAPVLLRRRAEKLSEMTGSVYVSKIDMLRGRKTIKQEFRIALSRPWILLFREPIVLLTSIYMAIIYGTLYMMFAAFPIVFQVQRGWSPGVGGLAFCGVAVGMICSIIYTAWDNKRYAAVVAETGGRPSPEARLPPAIVGSVLLPVGLFWFAWTNGAEIHWIVPIIASGFFASGLVLVFLSLMNYLIDSYVIFAASVLAANSVLRSLFGAAFPLFTTQMYHNLGIHWASSIPAFLALACLPFPFLFYRYGLAIRQRCVYAAEAAAVLEKMRAQHVEVDEDEAAAEVEEHEREKHEPRRQESGGVVSGDEATISGGVLSGDEATISGGLVSDDEGARKEKKGDA